jgi:Tat protein secretion system quality control protein TatD with DNase activity
VVESARQIGKLRNLSAEEIGRQTSENFRSFFGLADTTE